jgi:hypothetical protein
MATQPNFGKTENSQYSEKQMRRKAKKTFLLPAH